HLDLHSFPTRRSSDLDPANPPREVMLEWNDGCWEHRAFWGENVITWGMYGTSNRRDMGDLPPVGQWVRLEVPASLLDLEGAKVRSEEHTSELQSRGHL